VHSSILSRQKMLEDMANAVIIRGDVTDSTGYNTEGIDIPLNLHRLITDPNGTLHPYVDEVHMKAQDRWTHMYERTYQTTDENNEPVEEVRMQEEDIRVIAINSPQADMTIAGTEGAIQYAEGYDESMFSLTENLCILGRTSILRRMKTAARISICWWTLSANPRTITWHASMWQARRTSRGSTIPSLFRTPH